MMNIDLHEGEYLDEPLFGEHLIRADEIGKITYTRRGIIRLAEQLLNITSDFNKFFDKNNLILHSMKTGSAITSDFVLGKCEYKLDKSAFTKGSDVQKLNDLVKINFNKLDVQT